MRKILVPLSILSLIIALILLMLKMATPTFTEGELVFDSNHWDEFYLELSTEEPAILPSDWKDVIRLSPPPSDEFTRLEVEHIISLKPLRARYQDHIDSQLKDVVRPFTESLNLNESKTILVQNYWRSVVPDITRVHMHFKAKFNRARPQQYTTEVNPSIEPPGHPAYPSGHSTDAHSLALLLAEIWPESKSQLLSMAQQIALNREIGGVHYRSDTAAGILLESFA